MTSLLLALPHNEELATRLAHLLPATQGTLTVRAFPDGETYVRVLADCAGRDVIILAALDRPNDKVMPLTFLADAVREMGARRVGLVAPYLGYMRQDTRFNAGEAVTSRSFAATLERCFDWLATVDPHLHRYRTLGDLYRIPARVAHAAPALGAWIRDNVSSPVLVGPDSESAQWVEAVAAVAGAPYFLMEKERLGDRQVRLKAPDVSRWADLTPVLVDDIISTAQTMARAAALLQEKGMRAPLCAGVHAIFAAGAREALQAAGVRTVVTCNTISHPTNAIDVAPALAAAVRQLVLEGEEGAG